MKKFVLSLFIGVNIAVIMFSVMTTITADTSSAPIVAGFSIFLLVVAVAFRWVTSESANKGIKKCNSHIDSGYCRMGD